MGYSLAGKMAEKPKSCATFQACKVSLWRPLCLGIRSTELAAPKSAASQMNLILRHSNEYAYQNKRSNSAREYPITY